MNRAIQIILGLVVFVLVLSIALSGGDEKRKENWKIDFASDSKGAYGTFVFKKELEQLFPEQNLEFETKIDNHFLESLSEAPAQNIFIIDTEFNLDYELLSKLINAVEENGHYLFISALEFDYNLETLLDADWSTESDYWRDSVETISLLDKNRIILYPKGFAITQFTSYNGLRFERELYRPDVDSGFVLAGFQDSLQNGKLHLHSFPFVFSNYYLLHEDERYNEELSQLLSYFPQQKTSILISPTMEKGPERNKLEIIFSKPALRYAWKTLLIGILLFLMFRSKREQAAIKEYTVLENESKKFIQVQSQLYIEEEAYYTLFTQLVQHFIFTLKEKHFIDFEKFDDEFIEQVSIKTQSDKKKVRQLTKLIELRTNRKNISENQLAICTQLIDHILKPKAL